MLTYVFALALAITSFVDNDIAYEANKELADLATVQKIDRVLHDIKESDLPFLYSQLGNVTPGDFMVTTLRSDLERPCPYGYKGIGDCIVHIPDGEVIARKKIADMAAEGIFVIIEYPAQLAFGTDDKNSSIIYNYEQLKKSAEETKRKGQLPVWLRNCYKAVWSADELEQIVIYSEEYAKKRGLVLGSRPAIARDAISEYNKRVPPNQYFLKGELQREGPLAYDKYPYDVMGAKALGGRGKELLRLCVGEYQHKDFMATLCQIDYHTHANTDEYARCEALVKARDQTKEECLNKTEKITKEWRMEQLKKANMVNEEDELKKASLKRPSGCSGYDVSLVSGVVLALCAVIIALAYQRRRKQMPK